MLTGICFGTDDLKSAIAFYDSVMPILGLTRTVTEEFEAGYGVKGATPDFWIVRPFNEQPATHGNGTQAMFGVTTETLVDQAHQTALENGGTDEGPPGPRSYSPGYYGAYFRDLDGNKIHVAYIPN